LKRRALNEAGPQAFLSGFLSGSRGVTICHVTSSQSTSRHVISEADNSPSQIAGKMLHEPMIVLLVVNSIFDLTEKHVTWVGVKGT
jgi:hypothetical protein